MNHNGVLQIVGELLLLQPMKVLDPTSDFLWTGIVGLRPDGVLGTLGYLAQGVPVVLPLLLCPVNVGAGLFVCHSTSPDPWLV